MIRIKPHHLQPVLRIAQHATGIFAMRCNLIPGLVLIGALTVSTTALAQQQRPAERPPAFKKLVDCRRIADAPTRLACFDREVAAIDAAEAGQELVVLDKAQIKKTRRGLFGLSLPDVGIFGGSGADEETGAIETTIKRAWQIGDGTWRFELADGAQWVQTDSRNLASDPKPGHEIKIRRAAIGSYLANINKQVAIRVRRIR
ncbi:MAG TPA: hypothetical protein VGR19_06895 [Allosphingosinicella sp.]|nr:hypothetical protein [Allosphingosinicella sp.]